MPRRRPPPRHWTGSATVGPAASMRTRAVMCGSPRTSSSKPVGSGPNSRTSPALVADIGERCIGMGGEGEHPRLADRRPRGVEGFVHGHRCQVVVVQSGPAQLSIRTGRNPAARQDEVRIPSPRPSESRFRCWGRCAASRTESGTTSRSAVLLVDQRLDEFHDALLSRCGGVQLAAHLHEAAANVFPKISQSSRRSLKSFRRSMKSARKALKLLVVACRKSRISARISATSRSAAPASTRAAAASCSTEPSRCRMSLRSS